MTSGYIGAAERADVAELPGDVGIGLMRRIEQHPIDVGVLPPLRRVRAKPSISSRGNTLTERVVDAALAVTATSRPVVITRYGARTRLFCSCRNSIKPM